MEYALPGQTKTPLDSVNYGWIINSMARKWTGFCPNWFL